MDKYLSLLRGINVSGQKIIKMNDLKAMYLRMGLTDVITYIQSGNVVFSYKKNKSIDPALKSLIETAIQEQFGFFVPVEIRSRKEMAKIIERSPFDPDLVKAAGNKYYLTFLATTPSKTCVTDIQQYVAESETLHIKGKEAYFFCPDGYGRTKLTNNVMEKKLQTTATTRNWKTITKLFELLQ